MTQTGWGTGSWGSSPWGTGATPAPTNPVITPLSPLDGDISVAQSAPLVIRLTDDLAVAMSTLRVTVNGLDFVNGGVPVNGATMSQVANTGNGYDVTIGPPAPYGYSERQAVVVSVKDFADQEGNATYQFYAGVGLRLISVRNPMENMLLAHFNKALQLNDDFYSPGNWKLVPVSAGAAPLEIVEVTSNDRQPDVAHLRYIGGGSTYSLTVYSVVSQSGESIQSGYSSTEFEILYGDEDPAAIRLFDSVYGPLGISQQLRTRRTMDDHSADRSIALALDEQFRLRLQQLDGTIGRTGKPGIRRT